MNKFKIGQVWRTGDSVGVVTEIRSGDKYSADAERIAVVDDGNFTRPQICKFGSEYSVYGIALYRFEFENTNQRYVPALLKTLSPVEYSDFIKNVLSAPGKKPHIQQMEVAA